MAKFGMILFGLLSFALMITSAGLIISIGIKSPIDIFVLAIVSGILSATFKGYLQTKGTS